MPHPNPCPLFSTIITYFDIFLDIFILKLSALLSLCLIILISGTNILFAPFHIPVIVIILYSLSSSSATLTFVSTSSSAAINFPLSWDICDCHPLKILLYYFLAVKYRLWLVILITFIRNKFPPYTPLIFPPNLTHPPQTKKNTTTCTYSLNSRVNTYYMVLHVPGPPISQLCSPV